MHAAVRALLTEIIDYAGLFPPAKLPMEQALTTYLDLKKNSPYRWMLGRFVCPTAWLPELLALAAAHSDGALLRVAALGQQAQSVLGFAETFAADRTAIAEFRKKREPETVDVVEIPLPRDGGLDLARLMANSNGSLSKDQLTGFFEVPITPSWRDDLRVCAGIANPQRSDCLGLKLRCGGLTADAFPTDAQVARFIACCRLENVPWKATAGLHHPYRHHEKALGLWQHGFLNVFVAGVLAILHLLPEDDLVAILGDRGGQYFRFEPDCIAWKDWTATSAEITQSRAGFATSFGSCSFDEPIQDLLALGLLDAGA